MPAASARGRRSAAPEAPPIPRVDARPRPRRTAFEIAMENLATAARSRPVPAVPSVSRPAALAPTAAALAAAAAAPPEDENEQRCSVCMEALSAKRSVSLGPCKHEFHRTCVMQWLETRCCTGAQQCPLCRAVVEWLKEAGQRKERARAFGDSGQPTKRAVLSSAQHRRQDTMVYLDARRREVKHALARLRVVRARYVAASSSSSSAEGSTEQASDAAVVFLTDVDEEVEKLVQRARIYKEMKRAYRQGAMRANPADLTFLYDDSWNLRQEMADHEHELAMRQMRQEQQQQQQQPAADPFAVQVVHTDWMTAMNIHIDVGRATQRSATQRSATQRLVVWGNRLFGATAREIRAAAREARAARQELEDILRG